MSLYSIVVPVYNSEHTLEDLYSRLKTVFEDTLQEEFELILVDDSSKDRSFEIMQRLRAGDHRVKIIQMAGNFGQHPALLCGFKYAKGDFILTMDDDLQHPPEEVPKLVKALNERPDIDVVIGSYEGRQHNIIRRLGTAVSIYATSRMLRKDPDLELTSFRLMRRFIVDAILKTNTHQPQIGNLLIQTSNRIINVPIRHGKRAYGHSGYSFRKLAKMLLYDITTHSDFPLLVVRNIGFLTFLGSIIMSLVYLVNYFVTDIPVEGFTTLVLLILGFGGLILLSIGIIGIYLMNILNEAKKFPNYVTRFVDVDEEETKDKQE